MYLVTSKEPAEMADIAQVEETFKRIHSHKGIIGALVINGEGIAIRSTFENETTVHYAALVSHFVLKARGVIKKLSQDNELNFIRMRSQKHEILVAPEFEKSHEYYLVVV